MLASFDVPVTLETIRIAGGFLFFLAALGLKCFLARTQPGRTGL